METRSTCNLVRCVGFVCFDRCPDAHRNVYINSYLNHVLIITYAAPMLRCILHSPPWLVLDDVILDGWIHLIFTVSVTAPIFERTVPHRNIYINSYLNHVRHTLRLRYAMAHTVLAPMISVGRCHFKWMDTSNINGIRNCTIFERTVPLVLICVTR